MARHCRALARQLRAAPLVLLVNTAKYLAHALTAPQAEAQLLVPAPASSAAREALQPLAALADAWHAQADNRLSLVVAVWPAQSEKLRLPAPCV